MELNGTQQILVNAVNLLGKNMNTIMKNNETLLDASMWVGTEGDAHSLSLPQNAARSHHKKITNKSSENLAVLKHFGITLTDQNYIHEEVKCRLYFGNA
jgi:hypothetical protein